jgi:hypothetical protein
MSEDIPTEDTINLKLPVKQKKERSEAQKAATLKAMAVLKEKREAAAKVSADEADAKLIAKEKVRAYRKREPGAEIVTKRDLEGFMGEIKGMLGSKPDVEKPVVKEVVKVVEKPVVKEVVKVAPAKKQTGHELLDTLFNLR